MGGENTISLEKTIDVRLCSTTQYVAGTSIQRRGEMRVPCIDVLFRVLRVQADLFKN